MDVLAAFEGFDWDDGNRSKNQLKHNVLDSECEEVFFNEPLLLTDDKKHSDVEHRIVAFGVTNSGRRPMIVFTPRGSLLRVISAREMNRRERTMYKSYEEAA